MEQKVRVLIADSNQDLRGSCREQLSRQGIELIEDATSGEEALHLIKKYKPDVVLVDAWLSKLDGIQLIKTVRGMGHEYAGVPHLFMSTMRAPPIFSLRRRKQARHIACTSRLTIRSLPTGSRAFIIA